MDIPGEGCEDKEFVNTVRKLNLDLKDEKECENEKAVTEPQKEKEGAVDPLDILPPELWFTILEKLEDPWDFMSAARTCKLFNETIEKHRMKWVPPVRMVLPFVIPYLTKEDILKLRLVSSRFYKDVTVALALRPFKKYYWTSAYTNSSEFGIILFSHKCFNQDRSHEEEPLALLEEAKRELQGAPTSLPFVHLKLTGRVGTLTHERFIINFTSSFFFTSMPDFVEHVSITTEFIITDPWQTLILIGKILSLLPRIKSIQLNLQGVSLADLDYDLWREMGINLPLPPCHSRPFAIHIKEGVLPLPPMVQHIIFNNYHIQLVDMTLSFNNGDWLLPRYNCLHLKSLTVTSFSLKDVKYLERFTAPNLEDLGFNYKEAEFEDGSFRFLAPSVRHFQKLNVLRFNGIRSYVQIVDRTSENLLNRCLPSPVRTEVETQQMHMKRPHCKSVQRSTIYWLLPENVEVIYFDKKRLLNNQNRIKHFNPFCK